MSAKKTRQTKEILTADWAASFPKYSCKRFKAKIAPIEKTSLQVTENPKRDICLMTNKLAKTPCREIRAIRELFPRRAAPKTKPMTRRIWMKKIDGKWEALEYSNASAPHTCY